MLTSKYTFISSTFLFPSEKNICRLLELNPGPLGPKESVLAIWLCWIHKYCCSHFIKYNSWLKHKIYCKKNDARPTVLTGLLVFSLEKYSRHSFSFSFAFSKLERKLMSTVLFTWKRPVSSVSADVFSFSWRFLAFQPWNVQLFNFFRLANFLMLKTLNADFIYLLIG
jgi:hypothetical protein